MPGPVRFRVVPPEDGLTLSQLIHRRLPKITVSDARQLIKAGAVYVGAARVRMPNTRASTGERITLYPETLTDESLDPAALRIVHREPDFVILDKPPGVAVAATRASARGTLSEALRHHLEREGVKRPYVGVVHRLDRGASGLVLMTTRSAANASVQRLFVEHDIERVYRVLARGDVEPQLVCDAPLVALPGGRGVRVARSGEPRAQPARTAFRRLDAAHPQAQTSLVEARLTTGRTHQIRVHLASLGHPVVGDTRYAEQDPDDVTALHLHAAQLTFDHPTTGKRLHFEADHPPWSHEAST